MPPPRGGRPVGEAERPRARRAGDRGSLPTGVAEEAHELAEGDDVIAFVVELGREEQLMYLVEQCKVPFFTCGETVV